MAEFSTIRSGNTGNAHRNGSIGCLIESESGGINVFVGIAM